MKLSRHCLVMIGLLFFAACTKPEDIINDFQVHITPSFYKYVVQVELQNISNPDQEFSGNATVTITGEDADAIYNIDGTKSFAVNFGTLQLMVAREYEPTPNDPLEFTVNVEANGYKGVSVPILVEEESYHVEALAPLLDLNDLPVGMANQTTSQNMDPATNTLAQPLVLNTGTADSVSAMQVTIPTNIQFLDENGNVIKAKNANTKLEVGVLSYNDTSRAAQKSMPGGSLVQMVDDGNGNMQEELLDPTSTFEIEMKVNGQKVAGFKGGKNGSIDARINVPGHMINPETDAPYAEGDSISLMSLSHGDKAWKNDGGTYIVKKDPTTSKLYADAGIKHLSHWRYSYRWYWWRYRPLRRYKITGHLKDANGSSVNGVMYLRMYNSSNYRYSTMWYYLGGSFTDKSSRRNPTRYVYTRSTLYHFWTYSRFGPSFQTRNTSYQEGPFTVFDVEIENTVQPVYVGYRLFCEGSNTIVKPPAGVKMYYRDHEGENNQKPYTHLYTFTQENLDKSVGAMPKLENGKFYDFRARFNSTEVDTMNVKVVDGKIYDVILPSEACSELGL